MEVKEGRCPFVKKEAHSGGGECDPHRFHTGTGETGWKLEVAGLERRWSEGVDAADDGRRKR